MHAGFPPRRGAQLRAAAVTMTLLAGALLASARPAEAQTAPDSARSAKAGAYTAAQASAGEAVFRGTCGNCHSTSQFAGPAFLKVWAGRPVHALFDQLRNTMPLDNPGGLSREQYAAVVAYILKLNEYPAGARELPTTDAALRLITF